MDVIQGSENREQGTGNRKSLAGWGISLVSQTVEGNRLGDAMDGAAGGNIIGQSGSIIRF
jgi:hypothetical protein